MINKALNKAYLPLLLKYSMGDYHVRFCEKLGVKFP
jgi:hypothetical protein